MVIQVKTRMEVVEVNQQRVEGNQQPVEVNILLLGANDVGKTALTVRFLTRRFIGEYEHIEAVYSRVDQVDGQNICINILDSQGGESSCSITDKRLQWADGVILVYDLCNRRSFQAVCEQLRHLRGRKRPNPPLVIVANKRDLQRHRSVSGEEGRLLALSQGCGFFEVSTAEAYHGVLMVFHRLVHLIRETRTPKKSGASVRSLVRSMFGKKRTE